jgi:hypothetical protein
LQAILPPQTSLIACKQAPTPAAIRLAARIRIQPCGLVVVAQFSHARGNHDGKIRRIPSAAMLQKIRLIDQLDPQPGQLLEDRAIFSD